MVVSSTTWFCKSATLATLAAGPLSPSAFKTPSSGLFASTVGGTNSSARLDKIGLIMSGDKSGTFSRISGGITSLFEGGAGVVAGWMAAIVTATGPGAESPLGIAATVAGLGNFGDPPELSSMLLFLAFFALARSFLFLVRASRFFFSFSATSSLFSWRPLGGERRAWSGGC